MKGTTNAIPPQSELKTVSKFQYYTTKPSITLPEDWRELHILAGYPNAWNTTQTIQREQVEEYFSTFPQRHMCICTMPSSEGINNILCTINNNVFTVVQWLYNSQDFPGPGTFEYYLGIYYR